MNAKFEDLTVIDMISEQHTLLRKLTEERWQEVSDIDFSHTDFFLLGKVAQGDFSISRAAAMIKISRQAMQKCAAKLEERGYLYFKRMEGNQRDKFMALTDAGEACSAQYEAVKRNVEKEIAGKIGEKTLAKLKEILGTELV